MFTNRPYQNEAIAAGLASDNSVLVLPTGSGKSLVCAGIVNQVEHGVLVLQPSLEILQSNYAKAHAYGMNAGIYSASAGIKQKGRITYATIGSIIKKLEFFRDVQTVIIDECHLVNAKGGQYLELIEKLAPERLIGMTATPYRLASNSFGSTMRILTRTRPKIFKEISYVVNPRELVEQGFLLEPAFSHFDNDVSMLRLNTTGAEFTDQSRQIFVMKNNLKDKAIELIQGLEEKHILVFAESVAISKDIVDQLNGLGIPAAEINANTHEKIRASNLKRFESGEIRVMVCVRALAIGYDFPALDCIVDKAPTMSAALHYQKIGRVVRPYPGKQANVYDLAGNVRRLGNPLNYTMLKNSSGLHEVYGEKGRITTHYLSNGPECDTIIPWGRYKGNRLCQMPNDYLHWIYQKAKKEWKHVFYSEIKRRELFHAQ